MTDRPAIRPATFDKAVMAYVPALKKLARKLSRTIDEREELVQDTLAYVFTHWENFRGVPTAPRSGFYTWLIWQMRSVSSNQKVKRVAVIGDPQGLLMGRASVPANQEHAVELSMALGRLQTIPFGDTLLQFTAGVEQPDIAIEQGITRQAVSLRCQRARDDLTNGVSRRRPYKRTRARSVAKVAA